MKLGVKAESLAEWIGITFNLAPLPIVETQIAFNAARAIMAGAALGIFDTIGEGALTVDEIAQRCGTHARATGQLVHCLVGIGYLAHDGGRFSVPARQQKWMLRKNRESVADKLVFQITEWNWMAGLEEFVRSGKPLDIHKTMTPDQWRQYQDGMRDVSATFAEQVAQKLAVPAGATKMLDIGGSHGLYSIALCKKHPQLTSTILELPGAIDRASEIAAREGLKDRVQHREGNALTDDLGDAAWDVVFISNVVHHFTVPENLALAKKVKRALKPGGIYVIGEFPRGETPGEGGVIGATSDLYFAMTSSSGTWTVTEMQAWLRDAGFTVERPVRYLGPTYTSVIGRA
jgi:2-polyprenyl-3-methyl-5-hydroxy-6-metoxy-1,4-benzoquinol methylase